MIHDQMKTIFKDLLHLEDVQGIIFLSHRGKRMFSQYEGETSGDLKNFDWSAFSDAFKCVREAELVFGNNRIFYRRAELGQIIIIMGWFATIAMIRLKCNELLPAIAPDDPDCS
jgi:hypothetical protein